MNATNAYEIPDGLRGIAETGLDQSRRAFGTFFAAFRRNAELMQGASEFARNSSLDLAARSFDFAEKNIHATLDHAEKLTRTRDLQEALQIQAEFVRDRFGALQNQAREIGTLAQGTMQQGAEQAKNAAQESNQHFQKIAEQNQEAVRKAAETSAQTAADTAKAATH